MTVAIAAVYSRVPPKAGLNAVFAVCCLLRYLPQFTFFSGRIRSLMRPEVKAQNNRKSQRR